MKPLLSDTKNYEKAKAHEVPSTLFVEDKKGREQTNNDFFRRYS
ncbi:hypothetical protein Krac_9838 [Ktedonobacter racemifer DSM 44963]|jgi:hypothetical protein|uniref:Uncharacterized protein n=1 Tax=Ktedonobacter racemifer DSM 44963 TaxID=485913 RepID=D6TE17_KTERA|nr:hypothetical protein Krac_9838 [Ktedonobacter racemifer DSM 44963]